MFRTHLWVILAVSLKAKVKMTLRGDQNIFHA